MLLAGLRTNCRETRMKAGIQDGRGVIVIQVRDVVTWIRAEIEKSHNILDIF